MGNTGQLTVYRECEPVVDAEYEPERGGSPVEAVVSALAEAVGTDPIELPPLFEYVDLDALDALFKHDGKATNQETVLGFRVDSWNIFVCSDGCIRVCDATQQTEPIPVFESTIA